MTVSVVTTGIEDYVMITGYDNHETEKPYVVSVKDDEVYRLVRCTELAETEKINLSIRREKDGKFKPRSVVREDLLRLVKDEIGRISDDRRRAPQVPESRSVQDDECPHHIEIHVPPRSDTRGLRIIVPVKIEPVE